MKSEIMESRYFIECDCRTPEHLLSFDVELDKYSMISVSFTGNWHAPWYKRIWYAILFVIKKERFCWGDEIIISSDNIHQLEKVVKAMKPKRKKK